ncbi:MAG: type II secretion system minor pseudopilin GspJ [Gammaproteobacteria bacterium]
MSSPFAGKTWPSGFTLIELLVAMAVFSVIGVGSIMALNGMLDQQQTIVASNKKLQDLQRTMQQIRNDIFQVHPRQIRDVMGSEQIPALSTDTSPELLLVFSRDGWRNPLGLQRGTLQRVQYRLEDDVLIREYWPVMDRVLGTEPVRLELLENVDSAEFSFLDESDRWQEIWPTLQPGGTAPPMWPRAIRFTLEIQGLGEIERLYEVPR